jgi:hypothetical protein
MEEGAGTKLKKKIVELRAKVIEIALQFDDVEPTPEARKAWRDEFDLVAGDMTRMLLAYNARRGVGSSSQDDPDEHIANDTESSVP